jgi:pyrroline-5-carboxylate reductase
MKESENHVFRFPCPEKSRMDLFRAFLNAACHGLTGTIRYNARMMNHVRIGFIGGGNMARSLIGGLLATGAAPASLSVSEPDAEKRAHFASLGVTSSPDNEAVATHAETIVLAVKPQTMKAALTPLAPVLQQHRPLLLSIAAGIRVAEIERWAGGVLPVVRAMPNTPALVRAGAAGLYANALTSTVQRDRAESILRAVGTVVWLQDERLLDAVTALSGSGPAYVFLLMEALEQAAVDLGLDAATARLLTIETVLGSARLALESRTDPEELRRRVTSPGGTTERALALLAQGGFEELLKRAVAAAAQRAEELADALGKQ